MEPEPYLPDLYVPPVPIVRTHLLPRLGFPNDIGVLWEGNVDQIETYAIGIFVNSIIIVVVMAACLVVMAIVKCVGYGRVGFWVGHFNYEGSSEGEDDDDDGDGDEDDDDEGYEEDDDEDDVNDGENDNTKKIGDGTGNVDDSSNMESGRDGGTGILTARTIFSGEYRERSDHVSIMIKDPRLGNGFSTADQPSARAESSDEADPCSNGEERRKDDRVDRNGEENLRTDADDKEGITINTGPKRTRPAIRRSSLMVARIDSRDGRIIDLRPKPVPRELHRKVTLVRTMFVVGGFGAIISAGLFYALGVKKFKQSLVDTRSGITQFNELALKSIKVTNNLLDVQLKVENRLNATDKALVVIIRSCDLQSALSLLNTTAALIQYESAKRQFTEISGAIKGLLGGYDDNMRNVVEFTTWLYDQTYKADIAFTIMVLVMCIMIALIFIMIIGVAFAVYEIENCFTCFMRRVLLLPIFVLQVVLATLFAAIFFVTALAGCDFCISPDYNAQRLLARVATGADDSLSPLFTLVLFYLSGCRVVEEDLARTIKAVVVGMDGMLVLAHDLFNTFNAITPQDMLTYCSVDKDTILLVRYIDDLGETMHIVTHQLYISLYATLDILSCRSVYPVYSYLVHDAVCIGVVGGVNSVFSTMLAIAVLSMLMLALRAALYPIHVSVAADDSVGLEQLEENEVESRVNPQ